MAQEPLMQIPDGSAGSEPDQAPDVGALTAPLLDTPAPIEAEIHPAARGLMMPSRGDPRHWEVEPDTELPAPEDQDKLDWIMAAVTEAMQSDQFEDAFSQMMNSGMAHHEVVGTLAGQFTRQTLEATITAEQEIPQDVLADAGVQTIEMLSEMALGSGYLGDISPESEEYQQFMADSLEFAMREFLKQAAMLGEIDQAEFRGLFDAGLREEGLDPAQVSAEIITTNMTDAERREQYAQDMQSGVTPMPEVFDEGEAESPVGTEEALAQGQPGAPVQ